MTSLLHRIFLKPTGQSRTNRSFTKLKNWATVSDAFQSSKYGDFSTICRYRQIPDVPSMVHVGRCSLKISPRISKFSLGCCVDCCGSRLRVNLKFQDHDQRDISGTLPLSVVARYTRSALAHDLHAMSAHDKSHNTNSTSPTCLRNARAEACGIAPLSCSMRLVASYSHQTIPDAANISSVPGSLYVSELPDRC